ncbi:unnamed protein product [Sphagnum troendelagicum]
MKGSSNCNAKGNNNNMNGSNNSNTKGSSTSMKGSNSCMKKTTTNINVIKTTTSNLQTSFFFKFNSQLNFF